MIRTYVSQAVTTDGFTRPALEDILMVCPPCNWGGTRQDDGSFLCFADTNDVQHALLVADPRVSEV